MDLAFQEIRLLNFFKAGGDEQKSIRGFSTEEAGNYMHLHGVALLSLLHPLIDRNYVAKRNIDPFPDNYQITAVGLTYLRERRSQMIRTFGAHVLWSIVVPVVVAFLTAYATSSLLK